MAYFLYFSRAGSFKMTSRCLRASDLDQPFETQTHKQDSSIRTVFYCMLDMNSDAWLRFMTNEAPLTTNY